MKLHLVTYGDGHTKRGESFAAHAQTLANRALAAGFDQATAYGRDWLAGTAFERTHAALLRETRGAGYWVWKPHVIRTALDQIGEDDVLIYSDAGKRDKDDRVCRPDILAALAKRAPEGVMTGLQLRGEGAFNQYWTKRDCFVLMQAEHPNLRSIPQMQVGWSAWTKSDGAFALLDAWQRFNADRRIVSDDPNVMGLPNYDGFQENRHDQSIYTNLVYQMGLPFLSFADRPARWHLKQSRGQAGFNMRKFWGGEDVLRRLVDRQTARGKADPIGSVYDLVVRRVQL